MSEYKKLKEDQQRNRAILWYIASQIEPDERTTEDKSPGNTPIRQATQMAKMQRQASIDLQFDPYEEFSRQKQEVRDEIAKAKAAEVHLSSMVTRIVRSSHKRVASSEPVWRQESVTDEPAKHQRSLNGRA